MAKLDFPTSPTDGQVFLAPNGVNYTWNAALNLWTAKKNVPLAFTDLGEISGEAIVGKTLIYTVGVVEGGTPPYNYTWEWKKSSDGSVLQSGGAAYTVGSTLVDDTLFVELTVTDTDLTVVSGSTGVFPTGGSTFQTAAFPLTAFSPAGGPNASPSSVNTGSLFGTATATWADGPTSIYTTDASLLFNVDGGAFQSGPGSPKLVIDGSIITLIWNATTVASAADGQVLTASLTNGVSENKYSLTVTRTVTGLDGLANRTNDLINTEVFSNTIIPGGFNVPVELSLAASITDPLSSRALSVNGGSFSTTFPQSVIPGNSIRVKGTTGPTKGVAYGMNVSMGSPAATVVWTAETAPPVPAITTPIIEAPIDGATNLNPSLNIPAGIVLDGSDYTPVEGAGLVQTSSEWEVTTGSPGGTPISGSPFTVTTGALDSLTIPRSSLSGSTTYYARVRYATTNPTAVTSSFSPWSSFSTASSFVIPPGAEYGGGYFAGQTLVGGTLYNLIIAPILGPGGQQGKYGGTLSAFAEVQYKTSNTVDGGVATDGSYGRPATEAFANSEHPLFNWCVNSIEGPRSNGGLNGYTDWYIPAIWELMVVYFYLDAEEYSPNDTSSGSNPISVAPYTPNTNYGPGFPSVVANPLFRTDAGGAQRYAGGVHWSSTEANGTQAWRQSPNNGATTPSNKTFQHSARAIRRVVA